MNAELVFFGRRVSMARRDRRHLLVVLVYASLAVLMAGFWLIDHWRMTGVYLVFAAIFVNQAFLGGYSPGGLVKPFSARHHRSPVLGLQLYQRDPEDRESQNDERELHQRGHAHFLAYRVLALTLAVTWAGAGLGTFAGFTFISRLVLYSLLLVAVALALTLPQAILLWTEPDMEPEA